MFKELKNHGPDIEKTLDLTLKSKNDLCKCPKKQLSFPFQVDRRPCYMTSNFDNQLKIYNEARRNLGVFSNGLKMST